jgi:hypothetical protein
LIRIKTPRRTRCDRIGHGKLEHSDQRLSERVPASHPNAA